MAEAVQTTLLTGEFEDHQGRKLYPKTRADLVSCGDAQSVEMKLRGMISLSETKTVTLAAGISKTTVDLSAIIKDRSKTVYVLEILTSTADGETPVATVSGELIGAYAAFYRQSVTVSKAITITYRIAALHMYVQTDAETTSGNSSGAEIAGYIV